MRCALPMLCLVLASCVDVYRGAVVQMNLRNAAVSAPGEHFELYAVINGGVVPLERFKIVDSVAGCPGADPDTTVSSKLVQRYDVGAGAAELCETSRRLGNVDRVDLASAALLGGVRVVTDVDLSEAERLFVSVEVDGETDPAPARIIYGADLADGLAPRAPRSVECVEATCAALDPSSPLFPTLCEPLPVVPRSRRGVRVGIFLQEPIPTDDCGAVEIGEVSVLPAEDETFF